MQLKKITASFLPPLFWDVVRIVLALPLWLRSALDVLRFACIRACIDNVKIHDKIRIGSFTKFTHFEYEKLSNNSK
jgi:hypothetical protein